MESQNRGCKKSTVGQHNDLPTGKTTQKCFLVSTVQPLGKVLPLEPASDAQKKFPAQKRQSERKSCHISALSRFAAVRIWPKLSVDTSLVDAQGTQCVVVVLSTMAQRAAETSEDFAGDNGNTK